MGGWETPCGAAGGGARARALTHLSPESTVISITAAAAAAAASEAATTDGRSEEEKRGTREGRKRARWALPLPLPLAGGRPAPSLPCHAIRSRLRSEQEHLNRNGIKTARRLRVKYPHFIASRSWGER